MSRVNIDAQAFVDSRFRLLASLYGWDHPEFAIGFMARIWLECTLRETDILTEAELNCASPCASGVVGDQLVSVGLAEHVGDKSYRIKGCAGRTDWLKKKRRAGKKGGVSSGKARQAKRKSASPKNEASAKHGTNTPALAPAPARTPAHNPQTPTGGSDIERVVSYLNERLGRTGASCFQPKGKTRELIEARMADGATERELRLVCWHKSRQWRGTDQEQYLRPSTLFRKSKFEEYLPAAEAALAAREREKGVDPHKVPREEWKPAPVLREVLP